MGGKSGKDWWEGKVGGVRKWVRLVGGAGGREKWEGLVEGISGRHIQVEGTSYTGGGLVQVKARCDAPFS